jgi:hypothetical protein
MKPRRHGHSPHRRGRTSGYPLGRPSPELAGDQVKRLSTGDALFLLGIAISLLFLLFVIVIPIG